MEYKYQGIILNKRDIGEADRIYAIYTLEAGKIRVLAKGVRKPNAKLAGNLEPITRAEIFIAKNRGMGKITGSIPVNIFPNIKTNLDLINRVFYVFRILNKIISEEEKDERVFNLLEKYLDILESVSLDDNKGDLLTVGFVFKILGEMGYALEMERCIYCEKKLLLENNYFSAVRGGILCKDCQKIEAKKMTINNEAIKLIRIFSKNKLENLNKIQVAKKDINHLKIILRESLDWMGNSSTRF